MHLLLILEISPGRTAGRVTENGIRSDL